ncbi:MAG TPA: hypothetical protein VN887_13310 [Candidatus Angelobacter sp.]|nr:hypothetical protein [Candidatus Angelobacter sp.]
MGLFWDLIQQSQISSQSGRADSLEHRVAILEKQVSAMDGLLRDMLWRLEQRLGEDIDGDGKVR